MTKDVQSGQFNSGWRHGKPTMTDVARLAGVSQSSVSLVLNGMTGSRISPDTRLRVAEAARQIGYKVPAMRRSHATGGEREVIAYLLDDISTNPQAAMVLEGARDYAFEHGFIVTAYVTRANAESENAAIAAIKRDRSVIGIVYATSFIRRVTLPPALDMPVVLLNCYDDLRRHVSILPSEVAGMFNAAQHLIDLGHQRIGFINGEAWMDASADRLKGYRQALATADIVFDPRLVRDGDWLPTGGYQHASDLLALAYPPTAILCANDQMAVGALDAARDAGLKAPDDVSVMGYDNQEISRFSRPPLSTLVMPNLELGQRAAEALIDIAVQGKQPRALTIRIEGQLVPRASTARVRAAQRLIA
jgi:LacI family transcriptional regulator